MDERPPANDSTRTSPEHTRQRAAAFKGHAKQQFDAWAASYDRSLLGHFLFRPCYVALMEEIARWRRFRARPFRLLDIGCGTGTFCGLLGRSGWPASVVGLDYSPAMCARARQKAVGAGARRARPAFVAGDSEHLPFADASFDVAVCANSFHHYPHQGAVIADVHRILRPGGLFLLADGFRDNAIGWFVFDVIIASVEKQVYHAPWSEVAGHFRSAGFREVTHRKINVMFPALITSGSV